MLTDGQKARVLEELAQEFYLDNLRPAQEVIRASERHLLKDRHRQRERGKD
jgi:hypothetical protein